MRNFHYIFIFDVIWFSVNSEGGEFWLENTTRNFTIYNHDDAMMIGTSIDDRLFKTEFENIW